MQLCKNNSKLNILEKLYCFHVYSNTSKLSYDIWDLKDFTFPTFASVLYFMLIPI